jgi:hypothetical protein
MVEVNVGELDSEEKDGLSSFVESKLPVKAERKGDVVTFEDKSVRTHVSSPKIRTYLKRYLHKENLKENFRLLSEDGTLKFVKRQVEKEGKEEKEEEEEESKEKK